MLGILAVGPLLREDTTEADKRPCHVWTWAFSAQSHGCEVSVVFVAQG